MAIYKKDKKNSFSVRLSETESNYINFLISATGLSKSELLRFLIKIGTNRYLINYGLECNLCNKKFTYLELTIDEIIYRENKFRHRIGCKNE